MNNEIRIKKMKKLLLSGLLGLLVFPVFAVGIVDATRPPDERPLPGRDAARPNVVEVEDAIRIVFNTAFWALLAVAGLFFLMGAFYFLTGGQNEDNLKKGKSVITYAIIALVIAVLARGVAEFIPRVFGV